jgi:glycosyltransferase involved in cell wall biosynthesis
LVDSLNLTDCVILPGFIPNDALPYYYASCDLYVAPSIIDEKGNTEGLNVTILEAMSTGKPVVASRVGGITDAVGTAGLLVPQKDATVLSEAIIRILLNQNLARDTGTRGRQRILDHFTIDAVAESLISAFESSLCTR